MKVLHVEHPDVPGLMVEAVEVLTESVLREVRASDWHDGQLAVLSFPTAGVIGFVSPDNPKFLGGKSVYIGDVLVKGPAGDVDVVSEARWYE